MPTHLNILPKINDFQYVLTVNQIHLLPSLWHGLNDELQTLKILLTPCCPCLALPYVVTIMQFGIFCRHPCQCNLRFSRALQANVSTLLNSFCSLGHTHLKSGRRVSLWLFFQQCVLKIGFIQTIRSALAYLDLLHFLFFPVGSGSLGKKFRHDSISA